MLSAAVSVFAGALESLTLRVKFAVAAAVGVPLICPLAVFSVSPAGREPAESDHVYGVLPPVVATVAEYAVLT